MPKLDFASQTYRPSRRGGFAVALLLSLPALLVAGGARAQIPAADKMWVTNGPVDVIATHGQTTYLGGDFTNIGPATGGGVVVRTEDGRIPGLFPMVDGEVRAVVRDGAGGWFVGGEFEVVGGLPRANLAHIGADLTVTSWDPGADGCVRVLLLLGGTLFAGGDFTHAGGQPRDHLAAFNPITGAATAWDPQADGGVRAIVASGPLLYVGGSFTTIGGLVRGRIAALDSATGEPTAFAPYLDNEVRAITTRGPVVYVGGRFFSAGGRSRGGLAAFDSTTGGLLDWASTIWGVTGAVNAMCLTESNLYVGGEFTAIGVTARVGLGALDLTLGHVTGWNPGLDGAVEALEVSDSEIVAGGAFLHAGPAPRGGIARLGLNGLVLPWAANANGPVHAVATGDSLTYLGGGFTSVNCEPRNHIAAVSALDGHLLEWDPNADGTVRAIEVDGSTVYAGGDFATIGGQARNGIAALDDVGGRATGWNPDAGGRVHYVAALDVRGSTVFAGGRFDSIGGQPRSCIAALDAGTGLATAWNPKANGSVYTIAAADTTIYIGGDFDAIGGQPRRFIAAIDAVTGTARAWNPSAGANVHTLVLGEGTIYAGGDFVDMGGRSRHSLAALDATTGEFTSLWEDDPLASGRVYALTVNNGVLVAGGGFDHLGHEPRTRLAGLDATTGLATPWQPIVTGAVRTLASDGSTVYAGGDFTSPAGVKHTYFASFGTGVAGVEPPTARAGTAALAWPNPFTDRVSVAFTLASPARVQLEVLDLAGRRVWASGDTRLAAGRNVLGWDGTLAEGRAGTAGIYFLRVRGPGIALTRRVVRVH